MRIEDEAFIRQTIHQWIKGAGQEPQAPSYVVYEQSTVAELNTRLLLANQTIRDANKRIEELKANQYLNPNFAELGLDARTAFAGLTEDQIKTVIASAQRTRARFMHPDAGGSTSKMQKINSAADKLKDPLTRGKYQR